jgi:hypothetical protein
MMIDAKYITDLANDMATDHNTSVPADFDPQAILDTLGAEPWELTTDFEFLHDYGHAVIVEVSRALSI